MPPSKALNLRVKARNGQHTVNNFTVNSTVGELKNKLAELSVIPADSIRILSGFPPKPLDLTNLSKTLGMVQISSGNTLIVEEMSNSSRETSRNGDDKLLREIQTQYGSGEGILTREVVPADNNCLFTSINYVMEGGSLNLDCAKPMRELISTVVVSDPDTYSDGFLGKPNRSYSVWILREENWGGAIEVSILSKYYQVEIDVVDTKSGRIDRFGEDQNYAQRVLLIYDGVHYDPLKLESVDPQVKPITKFSTADDRILTQAVELAAEAKACRQYTDVQRLVLKCLICQKGFKGQNEAQEHAKKTGHINFGEM